MIYIYIYIPLYTYIHIMYGGPLVPRSSRPVIARTLAGYGQFSYEELSNTRVLQKWRNAAN